MKEERGILREVIDKDQPEESKARKYVRITIACVGMILILYVLVMAVVRRYAS
jgi:hypothetical protein